MNVMEEQALNLRRMTIDSLPTFNIVMQNDAIETEDTHLEEGTGEDSEYGDDHHGDSSHGHKSHKKANKEAVESLDFQDSESMMWRKVLSNYLFLYFYSSLAICFVSINIEDITNLEGNFGLNRVFQHSGSGRWLFSLAY